VAANHVGRPVKYLSFFADELVTELGGRGVWAQVDHGVEEQVEALFARLKRDEGRLDVLVNDIWGGDALDSKRNYLGGLEAGRRVAEVDQSSSQRCHR